MCKPFVVEVTRNIPLEYRKTLVGADKSQIALFNDQVVKFCSVPRTLDEIRQELGFDSITESLRKSIIDHLLKSGRLKYFYDYKSHAGQRYIDTNVEITKQMMDEVNALNRKVATALKQQILDFCDKPRGIREIKKHIKSTTANDFIRELIADNKLKRTYPDIPSSNKQQYIRADIEYKQFRDQDVVEYCSEPRTKAEIQQHFGISESTRKGVVNRLLKSGKIDYTEESKKLGKCDGNRRLVKNG